MCEAGLGGVPSVGLPVLAHQHEHCAILCRVVYEEGEPAAHLQQHTAAQWAQASCKVQPDVKLTSAATSDACSQ